MKKGLKCIDDDEPQSKIGRRSPRQIRKKNLLAKRESLKDSCRYRVLNVVPVVNRGTQIPKLKSKVRPRSDSSKITQRKVKKRISRSEGKIVQIGSRKVQTCTRQTQTLDTICPPPLNGPCLNAQCGITSLAKKSLDSLAEPPPGIVYHGPGGVYCGPISIAKAVNLEKMAANLENQKNQKNQKQQTLSKSPATKKASKEKHSG